LADRLRQRQGLAWDAFGIAVLPDKGISLTWGSVIGTGKTPAIYASVVAS
jgi:hypothetical protein